MMKRFGWILATLMLGAQVFAAEGSQTTEDQLGHVTTKGSETLCPIARAAGKGLPSILDTEDKKKPAKGTDA